jgi:hypothetical protein
MTDSQRAALVQVTEALHQAKGGNGMHQPKTTEEQCDAAVIRELYPSTEGAAKNTPKFVSFSLRRRRLFL